MDFGGGEADCLCLQHHLRAELERPHTVLFLVHTPPSIHASAHLSNSIVEPNRWLPLLTYKRFKRWRGGWDGSNVTVLSLDIFKCGCSICQSLAAPSFLRPGELQFCVCTMGTDCVLFLIFFWTTGTLLKWDLGWAFFRIMCEEIHSITVAVIWSLDTKEHRGWPHPSFPDRNGYIATVYCMMSSGLNSF